jgi:hypothetical protein
MAGVVAVQKIYEGCTYNRPEAKEAAEVAIWWAADYTHMADGRLTGCTGESRGRKELE